MSFSKWASITSASSSFETQMQHCQLFATAMFNMLSHWLKINGTKETQGGTCQNFDRDGHPIFGGLKFGQILFFQLFFWVLKISTFFLGLTNFQLFFGSSYFCITHLNPLNEEHMVLKNIKS